MTCESAFSEIAVEQPAGKDLRDDLIRFGQAFLSLILDTEAMAVHQLVIAERGRSPELGRLFFENAVRPTGDKLAVIIARYEEAGEIRTGDDPLAAAQDLLALLRGRPFMMIELTGERLAEAPLAAHVAHCVDFCLRAWTAR